MIESATEVVEMYQKTETVEEDVEETTEDEKLDEDSPLSSSVNSKYSNVVVFLDTRKCALAAAGKELVETAYVRVVQHRSFNLSTISRSC